MKPEYSPTYLQILRPERVVEKDEKSEEMRTLKQLVLDNAELKQETLELRNMLSKQMKSTDDLKQLLDRLLLQNKQI